MGKLAIGQLTAVAVAKLKKPGLYPDGGNLYLAIKQGGGKSWIFRFVSPSKTKAKGDAQVAIRRDMGLGPLDAVSLAEARELARNARSLRHAGKDPIEERERARAESQLSAARSKTFKDAADEYVAGNRASWKNPKHAQQWANTLRDYAYPMIGEVPVQLVDRPLVLGVLEQPVTGKNGKKARFWDEKPETAKRVRGRIEQVLDWSVAKGYRREGVNPARWKGGLSQALKTKAARREVKHHVALGIDELPSFITRLRRQEGVAARALEFLILTATRTTEVRKAEKSEINKESATWTIPAGRTKNSKALHVPLTKRALQIIEEVEQLPGGYLFPGGKAGKHLSENALLALLRRMKATVTAHGFRSTFKDWCSERTTFANELSERALGHAIRGKVEAAYHRTNLLEKRRPLMDAWANFAGSLNTPGDVIEIATRRAPAA